MRPKTKTLKETRSNDKATLYMLYKAVDEFIFEKIAHYKKTTNGPRKKCGPNPL